MQFSTIVTIIASVAFVSAQGSDGNVNTGNQCKVNQKQACCDTDSSGVLGGLLGGSCELNIRWSPSTATRVCLNN